MGDQRPPATLGQVLDPAGEAVAERPGRRLQQDPVAAAQGHPAQLLLVEALDRGLGDLAALEDDNRNPLFAQPRVESVDPSRDLLDADVVVVTDVRRRADRLDSVRCRLARHADAVAEVERPVVDAGEDVAVQVDHVRPRRA